MKKILAMLLAVVMIFALCACGQKAAPAAEEAAPAAAPAAEASGDALVYWSMWEATEPQGMVIQEAINAFTAETGIPVDVQFKGRQGIRQGLQPALDAGTKIDLFDEGVDRVNMTWGNYILDLEQFVADSSYEDTAIATFIDACREAGGGTLKSIPYQGSIFAWFYNPDIFEEAGITAVPSTWDEFLDCCEKIKAAGYVPITSDDAYFTSNLGYHIARYIGQEATVKVVQEGLWAETPEVLQAAKDFEELATKGYFSPNIASNVWPNGQNVEFALGDAAMYLNGSWLPNEIRGLAGDDYVWGCFAYPSVGGVDDTSYANTSFQVFAINNKSDKPEEAFKLIEWLTKGEWDLKLSQGSLGVPADVNNTEWPAQMANVKPVMDQTANRYIWAVGLEDNVDLYPIIIGDLQKLAGGTMTAEEFVADLEAASK